MTDKDYEEMGAFLKEHSNLFPPTNSKPSQEQTRLMFYYANLIDPRGNHKPSSCGRCYHAARRAIINSTNIF